MNFFIYYYKNSRRSRPYGALLLNPSKVRRRERRQGIQGAPAKPSEGVGT